MCAALPACGTQEDATSARDVAAASPVAKIVPHELETHGDVRVDNYYWLKEREALRSFPIRNLRTRTLTRC